MKYTYDSGQDAVVMTNFDSFCLEEILECGQCFRFQRLGSGGGTAVAYEIIAHGRLLWIEQSRETGTITFMPCPLEEFEEYWMPYFDLEQDYGAMKQSLGRRDWILREAIDFAPGIRILRQDPFETLISFIISQNNHIPRIKRIIGLIAQRYGSHIGGPAYAFPSPEQLALADEEALLACNAGFRAKYIMDAVRKVREGVIPLAYDTKLATDELRQMLKQIKGVGDKVAACVLLFGYGRMDCFPVDVWVRRIMEDLYFKGASISPAAIQAYAAEFFAPYGGLAQQYLFHYARQAGMRVMRDKNQ